MEDAHGLSIRPQDFDPRLLVAYLFTDGMNMPAGSRLEDRLVRDYEAEYILEGGGAQVIDGRVHPVRAGDLVWRRPGSTTQGIMPYSCYCAIFSLRRLPSPRPEPYQRLFRARDPGVDADLRVEGSPTSAFLDAIPPVFRPAQGDAFRGHFELLLRRYASPSEGSELLVKATLLRLVYELRAEARDPALPRSEGGAVASAAIREGVAFMRASYARKLPLAEIAAHAGYSPSHFQRAFTAALGESPLSRLTAIRIDAAKELLASTELTVEAVARDCGFDNAPYFHTLFKKRAGETPAEFRRRHRYSG